MDETSKILLGMFGSAIVVILGILFKEFFDIFLKKERLRKLLYSEISTNFVALYYVEVTIGADFSNVHLMNKWEDEDFAEKMFKSYRRMLDNGLKTEDYKYAKSDPYVFSRIGTHVLSRLLFKGIVPF